MTREQRRARRDIMNPKKHVRPTHQALRKWRTTYWNVSTYHTVCKCGRRFDHWNREGCAALFKAHKLEEITKAYEAQLGGAAS